MHDVSVSSYRKNFWIEETIEILSFRSSIAMPFNYFTPRQKFGVLIKITFQLLLPQSTTSRKRLPRFSSIEPNPTRLSDDQYPRYCFVFVFLLGATSWFLWLFLLVCSHCFEILTREMIYPRWKLVDSVTECFTNRHAHFLSSSHGTGLAMNMGAPSFRRTPTYHTARELCATYSTHMLQWSTPCFPIWSRLRNRVHQPIFSITNCPTFVVGCILPDRLDLRRDSESKRPNR